jgi:eukaryotic-like serine/threonine-protein kinase
VFAQNPPAGKKVATGSTVDIHVAAAKPPTPVPDVVGRTKDVADQLMRSKGFVANFIQEQNDNVQVDNVIRQNPPAGQLEPGGFEVDVVISTGKGQAAVPNVRGHPFATAANELGIAGFQTTTQMQTALDVGPGDVIATNPPAGTVVDRGTTVTIIVSTGPPATTTTTTKPGGTTTTTTKP